MIANINLNIRRYTGEGLVDVLIVYALCETCQPTVFALLLGNVYLGTAKVIFSEDKWSPCCVLWADQ